MSKMIVKLALFGAILCALSGLGLAVPAKGRVAEPEPSKTTRIEQVQQERHTQELERAEQEPDKEQYQQHEQVQLHETQEREPERQLEEQQVQQQIIEGAQPRAEAEPYAFSYNVDGSARSESGDSRGVVRGFYRLAGPDGSSRLVEYVADHQGFRATVNTNELGTEPQSPAHVAMRSSQPLSAAQPVVHVAAPLPPVAHAPVVAPAVPLAAPVVAPVEPILRAASLEFAGVKGRELPPPPPPPAAPTKGRELLPPPQPPQAPTKGRIVQEERKGLPPARGEIKTYQRLSPSRAGFATATRHAHYPVAPRAYQYNRPIYAQSAPLAPRRQPGAPSFYGQPGFDDEQPIGFDVE